MSREQDERPDLAEDPFGVAAGDADAVARRVEKFLDAEQDQSWLERARADIAAGRTISVRELRERDA